MPYAARAGLPLVPAVDMPETPPVPHAVPASRSRRPAGHLNVERAGWASCETPCLRPEQKTAKQQRRVARAPAAPPAPALATPRPAAAAPGRLRSPVSRSSRSAAQSARADQSRRARVVHGLAPRAESVRDALGDGNRVSRNFRGPSTSIRSRRRHGRRGGHVDHHTDGDRVSIDSTNMPATLPPSNNTSLGHFRLSRESHKASMTRCPRAAGWRIGPEVLGDGNATVSATFPVRRRSRSFLSYLAPTSGAPSRRRWARVVVAASCQDSFAASIVDGRRLEPAPVDVAAGRGHGAGLCRDEREEACVRSTHVFDEHVQCYSAVGLTRGTEPHHSNFWPRPIDGMTGYFSSIAGSQGCAAASHGAARMQSAL